MRGCACTYLCHGTLTSDTYGSISLQDRLVLSTMTGVVPASIASWTVCACACVCVCVCVCVYVCVCVRERDTEHVTKIAMYCTFVYNTL